MKILLVSLNFYPTVGGVENSLKYMAKELRLLGHDVRVLSFDNLENTVGYQLMNLDGIQVYKYYFKGNKIPALTHFRLKRFSKKAIQDIYKDFVPDQIWSRNSIIAAGLIQSKFVINIKHIFSTTSTLNVQGLYSNIKNLGLIKRVIFEFLKRIDLVSLRQIEKTVLCSKKTIPFVFSKMMKDQLFSETHNLRKVIYVIRPGVDSHIFNLNLDPEYIDQVLAKIPKLDHRYVLYVGRIARAKNIEILIESFDFIENVNLIIVGKGPYTSFLKKYVEDRGLNNRIFFIGEFVNELPVIYSRAEATILPSKVETFGQVLIESLACGTPVIGFGNNSKFKTAITEIIQNSFNGVIVEEFSARKLADAILSILDSGHEAKVKRKLNNSEYIERNFSWKNTVTSLLDIE